MNVGAVGSGAGATAPDPLRTGGVPAPGRAAVNPSSAAAPAADSVASFLATGRIADLLAGIDQRRPIQSPEVIAEALRAIVFAAEVRDVVRALERVRELVAMDPERADTLASEPELDSIRTQVNELLRQLAAVARSDAEQKLDSAHQALATDGGKLREADQQDLQTVLAVAVQLFETGRHANYVRAGDLAEIVMTQCGWTVAGVPVWAPVEARRHAASPIFAGVWLVLGIFGAVICIAFHITWPVAAIAISAWGAGFLALAGFYPGGLRAAYDYSRRFWPVRRHR